MLTKTPGKCQSNLQMVKSEPDVHNIKKKVWRWYNGLGTLFSALFNPRSMPTLTLKPGYSVFVCLTAQLSPSSSVVQKVSVAAKDG